MCVEAGFYSARCEIMTLMTCPRRPFAFDRPDDLVRRDLQRLRDLEQRIQCGAAQAALDLAVMRPVQTGQTAQKLLGHALFDPVFL